MPKLKVISGKDIIKLFNSLGFVVISQRGSHIKLERVITIGTRQILTVPNHKEIDRGTLKGIINQASRYVPETELKKLFYTK